MATCFWEHTIRDDADYASHMDHVHFNPVKPGYVVVPADWPFSSFRHAVTSGRYPPDWNEPAKDSRDHGERPE